MATTTTTTTAIIKLKMDLPGLRCRGTAGCLFMSLSFAIASYSFVLFIFSKINTANDLLRAWIVDYIATQQKRADPVALWGLLCLVFFNTLLSLAGSGGT